MCIRDRKKGFKIPTSAVRAGLADVHWPGRLEYFGRVLLDGAPLELTETEFSILQCLAQNRGRVVPVRTIYETVWHETYMPASNNTVMVHIVNLRKKLEEDPANPRLIRTVWGKGYQID